MKKILVFMLLAISLLAEKEKNVYFDIKKETNGGYFLKLPCVETKETFKKYTEYTKLSLNFTLDRGKIEAPNHHSISFERTFEIEKNGFYVSFSCGADYYLAENDDGVKEGFYFNNTLKIGYKERAN